jgi:hypothetical protein
MLLVIAGCRSTAPSVLLRAGAPAGLSTQLQRTAGSVLPYRREPFATPQSLDSAALATFIIISDHKGLAPDDVDEMTKMREWSADMRAQFCIGMGDHVKRGLPNAFLGFIRDNVWWRQNFYPNIADGENQYWGTSQADWCAGGEFLTSINLNARPAVQMRANGCEYYVQLRLAGYTIHLIQIHFPDEPSNAALAFPEDSRAYLCSLLVALPQTPKDIIVVGAHSRTGNWLEVLEVECRALVLDRATIVLSATTHRFERLDYGSRRALCINTGSLFFTSGVRGYVTVHLLPNPSRLLVQYVDVRAPHREFAPPERAYAVLLDTRQTYPVEFGRSN